MGRVSVHRRCGAAAMKVRRVEKIFLGVGLSARQLVDGHVPPVSVDWHCALAVFRALDHAHVLSHVLAREPVRGLPDVARGLRGDLGVQVVQLGWVRVWTRGESTGVWRLNFLRERCRARPK